MPPLILELDEWAFPQGRAHYPDPKRADSPMSFTMMDDNTTPLTNPDSETSLSSQTLSVASAISFQLPPPFYQRPTEKRDTIRTGCAPCRSRNAKCYPHRASCESCLTDEWASNRQSEPDPDETLDGTIVPLYHHKAITPQIIDRIVIPSPLDPHPLATVLRGRDWRERAGVHFYMDYTGPQLAASPELFYTRFWRHRLLQAACYQPAILHAITALGALHEEMIRNARLGHQSPGPNMTFSLQQCNKAIHYILNPPDGRQTDPRVVLTTCLIFSTFYSIRGEIRAAIDQGLNVKRLLQRCLDAGPGPLDDTISIESLEPQARHVYMRARLGPDAVRAAVTRAMTVLRVDDPPNEADFRAHTITINSLEDAQVSLNKLLELIRKSSRRSSIDTHDSEGLSPYPAMPLHQSDEASTTPLNRYIPALRQWENSFYWFLSQHQYQFDGHQHALAQLLKANHLYAMILAMIDPRTGVSLAQCADRFEAIVRLIGSVLDSGALNNSHLGTDGPLGVYAPLFLTMNRAPEEWLKVEAKRLLDRATGIEVGLETG